MDNVHKLFLKNIYNQLLSAKDRVFINVRYFVKNQKVPVFGSFLCLKKNLT